MSKPIDEKHQIIRGESEWKCSCGAWSLKVPKISGYSDTTAEARGVQMEYAHGKHVRKLAKVAAGSNRSKN
jgi:hypothetical protein